VASYGGVAASGGYYVSCASDYIMAQETTITGSIGVIAQVMTFEGLMDKIGVEPVTLVARRSPAKSVANDVFRAWTDDDRGQVLSMLDSAYDIFHTRVADGRRPAIDDLDAVATGAVFTAQQALDGGLIDGIGYLDDAIAEAEKRASLRSGSATVRSFHERPSLFGGLPLVQGGGRGALDRLDADSIRSLINDLGAVRLMYLMH
jgi:protease-4